MFGKMFGILLHRRVVFFSPISLFNHVFISELDSWIFIFFTPWVITKCCNIYFVVPIGLHNLAIGSFFSLSPVFL